MLLKFAVFIKNWFGTFIKNLLILAITYKFFLWLYGIVYDFVMQTHALFVRFSAFNDFVFVVMAVIVATITVLLGLYPVTRFWIFRLKKVADEQSYFPIKCPAEGGGWMYGFSNHNYLSGGERLYDAVVFWGGFSRKFGLKASEFKRLNMTIPEVIMLAYVTPWIPFLTKVLPHDEEKQNSAEK
ncbi:hypothetical protein A2W54_03600 [Candidatus Giovannonibacteria bacterium RIFCSPHIGHO2_02_43_13]|uniref:Uncharacterized protein n=1 Tax=Candidatus Giovannonibacteria bacterium RIFCSPHIGHO2_02_43_13 TaxID=1798330 RepID=A0A1F5WQB3_9BACT|nr:MAG: hypothetical protein UW28_C0007G0005 [Parcubacteria group bacterium GW2011_GWA2_44_13]OGF73968.1 MAG: hypothetical protein A3E06_00810 [Candidatus Giovannonibacteria bacterium RIFCSPHIGHO2_12_FULL_44_42]OGF77858.1 MAG: hypothetical protein A2W54_03600 [Candidatus Giovannonibacteria bacterium RIFCSPHIGHO2_02_43_13]OGF88806.1 MAG: hypothetical protein A3I94_02255 [Candidatus Giovannonibacteria bacterium RIFCSPLOWO2_02_FULL_43_54]OGF96770.1 MAG: hypothetical protein A3H08_01145 [Candidatus